MTTPIAQGPVDVNVRWLPGWYASRLHALPEDKVPTGTGVEQALCGQLVYGKARTNWAQRKIDKGVPHCKRCEKLLTPNGEVRGASRLAGEASSREAATSTVVLEGNAGDENV